MKIHKIVLANLLVLLTACGGGGGGSPTDTFTINMSPLRIVGFSDDNLYVNISSSLYPIVYLDFDMPAGKTVLMRMRDPYGVGDFYSIEIRNGFGGGAAPAMPISGEGEPDNNSIDASLLLWDTLADRDLNPVYDEDWFSFTSSGEGIMFINTRPNASGSSADPILEIYDPTPNLGPVTYDENLELALPSDHLTLIAGVFDPINDLTLVGFDKLNLIESVNSSIDTLIDINAFFLVFSGPPTPGDYPIQLAAPPAPSVAPGSVTGSIHIDQYDDVGGRIVGSFNLTIVDDSRTTTVSGSFTVTREQDEGGLLTGLKPEAARATSSKVSGKLRDLFAYLRQ